MIWNPIDELNRMHEYIDRMFNRGLEERHMLEGEGVTPSRIPITEVKDKDKNIEMNIEMPGISKENIDVEIKKDYVEVKGTEKKEENEEDKYKSKTISFYRKIPVSGDIDPDNSEAKFKDGLLKMSIPKKEVENKQKKKIEIK